MVDERRRCGIGDRVPGVTFRLRDGAQWVEKTSAELFGNRRVVIFAVPAAFRSEEHTSELQSLMRITYAVLCLKKTKKTKQNKHTQIVKYKSTNSHNTHSTRKHSEQQLEE